MYVYILILIAEKAAALIFLNVSTNVLVRLGHLCAKFYLVVDLVMLFVLIIVKFIKTFYFN